MIFTLMGLSKIYLYEQAVVQILNMDNWDLKWAGNGFEHYDAIGKTPKGHDCVIEMKFRKKYYKEKMLEVYKYEQLISMDSEIVKLYFVSDPKGNYLYWLNYLDMPEPVDMYCPDTTMWTKKRLLKPVYLLTEQQASIINRESYN
jgi:hypothetical protein